MLKEIRRYSSFFAVILCLVLIPALITGCNNAGKSREKEIVIWHWMSDRQSAFEELARQYEAETGIAVKFEEFFPPDVYSQKIQAAAAADDLPDLFGILGEKKIFSSFIKGGYINDLTPFMEENQEEWKNRFIEITLQFNTFKDGNIYGVSPGIYGVPIDIMSIQFLYNRKLSRELGFNPQEPPRSWNDFLTQARAVKNKPGVYGFVSGWGEGWLIYCMITDYAFNVLGEEKFFATMKGEVPYTDPGWVKIFSSFLDMQKEGVLASGILTMNNKEAEQIFASDKALFSFNGSWGINTYQSINPDLDYGTMLPPALSDEYPVKIWAGAGSSFVVSKTSAVKTEAVDFLKWITEIEQQRFLIEQTKNLPAVKGCEEDVEDYMKKFLEHMDNTTHPNLWPLNESPRVVERINIDVQKIIIGEMTPEEMARDVQKIKELTLE